MTTAQAVFVVFSNLFFALPAWTLDATWYDLEQYLWVWLGSVSLLYHACDDPDWPMGCSVEHTTTMRFADRWLSYNALGPLVSVWMGQFVSRRLRWFYLFATMLGSFFVVSADLPILTSLSIVVPIHALAFLFAISYNPETIWRVLDRAMWWMTGAAVFGSLTVVFIVLGADRQPWDHAYEVYHAFSHVCEALGAACLNLALFRATHESQYKTVKT